MTFVVRILFDRVKALFQLRQPPNIKPLCELSLPVTFIQLSLV